MPCVTAIRALRMRKDQLRVGHTIHPSDSWRRASERPPCCGGRVSLSSIFGSCSWAISPLRSGGSNCGVPKRSRRDQAGRRNVERSCQCGGDRIQACRRSERWRVFGRGRTEEAWRCAGRFERAVTMVLLPRDDREPRLDLSCRRPILLGSSSSSTSPVSGATAMQRFR